MKIILLVGLIAFSNANATDLGTFGKTYNIDEDDLSHIMKSKMIEKQESGELDTFFKDLTDRSKKYVRRPKGYVLPRAREYRAIKFDPTIILEQDIYDAEGNVLYPMGTTINPLDFKPMSKTLCFIDGDDIEQVKWLENTCTDSIKFKSILVNGNVIKLSEEMNKRLYFDQDSVLRKHFNIQALPTVIRQNGRYLHVEELKI
ncbi:MAG: type-F conjugative transfer system protein TraW [Methylococcales bacterium]